MLEQAIRKIAREEARREFERMMNGQLPAFDEDKPTNPEARITSMLHNLGISPAIKGFRAIAKAVLLVHDNPEALDQITNTSTQQLRINVTPQHSALSVVSAMLSSERPKSNLSCGPDYSPPSGAARSLTASLSQESQRS